LVANDRPDEKYLSIRTPRVFMVSGTAPDHRRFACRSIFRASSTTTGPIRCLLAVCLAISSSIITAPPASGDTLGPQRQESIIIPVTIYEWWLMSWDLGKSLCQIYIEHEGKPNQDEIL
jgi:hypothetical protein